MRPCRKSPPPCRAAGTPTKAPPSSDSAAAHVNRYRHPIRTKDAARSAGTEELLHYVLETLAHQADLLEELLRRTAGQDTR